MGGKNTIDNFFLKNQTRKYTTAFNFCCIRSFIRCWVVSRQFIFLVQIFCFTCSHRKLAYRLDQKNLPFSTIRVFTFCRSESSACTLLLLVLFAIPKKTNKLVFTVFPGEWYKQQKRTSLKLKVKICCHSHWTHCSIEWLQPTSFFCFRLFVYWNLKFFFLNWFLELVLGVLNQVKERARFEERVIIFGRERKMC